MSKFSPICLNCVFTHVVKLKYYHQKEDYLLMSAYGQNNMTKE